MILAIITLALWALGFESLNNRGVESLPPPDLDEPLPVWVEDALHKKVFLLFGLPFASPWLQCSVGLTSTALVVAAASFARIYFAGVDAPPSAIVP